MNPQGLALLAAAGAYMTLSPGVAAGWVDTYILAPLQRRASKVYGKVRGRCCRCPAALPLQRRQCYSVNIEPLQVRNSKGGAS